MTTVRRVQLTLDVDLDAEPIAGRLRSSHNGDVPFVGWVELARAIQAALTAARAELATTDGRQPRAHT